MEVVAPDGRGAARLARRGGGAVAHRTMAVAAKVLAPAADASPLRLLLPVAVAKGAPPPDASA